MMVNDGKYRVGVVGPRVTKYFSGKNFIAVVQQGQVGAKESLIDERYFIVPFVDKVSEMLDKNVIGPMSYDDFLMRVKEIDSAVSVKFQSI